MSALASLAIDKYPRTRHLEGSRLQKGDEDGTQVPYAALAGTYLVGEEKKDGANCGVRFSPGADLLLQSRGHYLGGGNDHDHFNQLKVWAAVHEDRLFDLLGSRYVMYGEWMAAKHTVFYDHLPHLFLEFDILDTETGRFLSTAARQRLIQASGAPIVSVPVLHAGPAPARLADLVALIRPSLSKTPHWREALVETARRRRLDVARVLAETEASDLAEGLYLKIEEGDYVVDRLKWVRADFVQTLIDSDSHWRDRPLVPNQLRPGVDLFAPTLTSGDPWQSPWPAPAAAEPMKRRMPC